MRLELLGIPDNKMKQLQRAGIESIEDLARYYPRRYNDFRTVVRVDDLMQHVGEVVSVVGQIVSIKQGGTYTTAYVRDGSERMLGVTWFNQPYIECRLYTRQDYVFCGKVQYNQQFDSISMPGPLFFSNDPADFRRIMPVYKKVKGMADEYLSDCIKKAVALILADKDSFEYLESSALERLGVPAFKRFLPMVHAPQGDSDLKISERRKIVDELFPFAMKMTQRKGEAITQSIYQVQDRNLLDTFVHNLPYQLTKDQNAAIQEIVSAMESGRRVDALVQGDVGCGKTVVAMALCVVMAHNGFQSAVMAPTTVLAEQHYKKFRDALAPLGITVDYLVSGMSAKERSQILSSIEKGETQVVVGTHAVIADAVKFKSLGLTIVDEEHRFGVEQRGLLQQKAKDGVHSVSMTATPIPRTLAVTLYGENTRIINIRSMPSGRKPVITVINSKPEKVWAAMHRQINEGHQCYVVCPLIEESDNDALTGVASAEEISKQLKNWFAPYPEVTVDLITGDLKKETIQKRLEAFAKGKSQILVSTTIVEVGVDVPNATVMVIQNAERFGLAQLHQLRGRVGRGKAQGYCVLLSQKKESSRLQIMTETSDGFEIAQSDLEMRGSGNWVGTKQHGFERSITMMLQNPEIYSKCIAEAERLYKGKAQWDKCIQMFEPPAE